MNQKLINPCTFITSKLSSSLTPFMLINNGWIFQTLFVVTWGKWGNTQNSLIGKQKKFVIVFIKIYCLKNIHKIT